jgi:hypothetical protein
LPFTSDEFSGVFALYNQTFIVVAAALWLASAGMVAFVARDPERRSRTLSLFLAVLWLWNAVAYHALFFTRINPAAWLFAALFVVQAVLFLWTTAGRRIEYFSSIGWRRRIGQGVVAYGLAYPFLTIALGHSYPATPTFGVPCPTAILTIGVLVGARGQVPLALAIVPIVWGFIGGSAAVLLAVPTDYVLLGGRSLFTANMAAQRVKAGRVVR